MSRLASCCGAVPGRRPKPSEPTESPLHTWPQVERPPVEYEGIATSRLERPDFTPYEFETDGGVWVRLHDMRFVGFDYLAQPPTLTMRFVYDDPEWTPPGARTTPVAVFEFSGVQVWQWEDDHDLSRRQPMCAARSAVSTTTHPPTCSLLALLIRRCCSQAADWPSTWNRRTARSRESSTCPQVGRLKTSSQRRRRSRGTSSSCTPGPSFCGMSERSTLSSSRVAQDTTPARPEGGSRD